MPSEHSETPASPLAPLAHAAPRALEESEHVELWLAMPAGDPAEDADGDDVRSAVSAAADMDSGGHYAAAAVDADVSLLDIDGWDVRPAQVVTGPPVAGGPAGAWAPAFIALATGGWGLSGEAGSPSAPGARAIVRRIDADGIAEWEGTIAAGAEEVHADLPLNGHFRTHGAGSGRSLGSPGNWGTHSGDRSGSAEAVLVLRLDEGPGRLYQRRRSPRLAVRLSPVRLVPLADEAPAAHTRRALEEDGDLAPVARLSDVSAHGAAIVVDMPLETGTTVALEFELPGEPAPFTVRGRVVEPATSLHGEAQPQPDGLPGFRRGIEFLSNAAGRESRRLATVVTRLLQRDTTRE